jgi:AraC-like DNA-binding protein
MTTSSAGLGIGESGDFGFTVKAARVGDVVIADVCNDSFTGREKTPCTAGHLVLMHLVRRGAWHFAQPGGRGGAVTTPAGSFAMCHDGPPPSLEADPGTAATVLILPASALGPLTPGRVVVGSARSAEARVLMAHASTVGETAGGLSPAGVWGARDALLHLVRAVLSPEPGARLGPAPAPALALALAAMEMADGRLADPDLSPALLAGELNVSVRTLHRAFAAAGEPVAAYIRRRRLERARAELVAAGRPGVSEIAARWHFADSSHFIRAFRKQYGETPALYRSNTRLRD